MILHLWNWKRLNKKLTNSVARTCQPTFGFMSIYQRGKKADQQSIQHCGDKWSACRFSQPLLVFEIGITALNLQLPKILKMLDGTDPKNSQRRIP